ncbi:MAG: phosphoglycerate mutase family protein [Gammaproteobacteria bacterium]|nr:phosphoglycerate mutase family protein [Gammaproteobacteria bacterium]
MKKIHRTLRRRPLFTPLVMPVMGFVLMALAIAWFFDSRATTAVFIVRHAEKALMPVDDPGLSDLGRERAEELARVMAMSNVNNGPDHIFVSQFRRSLGTVEPLIRDTGLPVSEYRAEDSAALVDELLDKYRGQTVLVVAHSNTVAEIIELLGGKVPAREMTEQDYDDLYVVGIPRFGRRQTLRFKYGRVNNENKQVKQ